MVMALSQDQVIRYREPDGREWLGRLRCAGDGQAPEWELQREQCQCASVTGAAIGAGDWMALRGEGGRNIWLMDPIVTFSTPFPGADRYGLLPAKLRGIAAAAVSGRFDCDPAAAIVQRIRFAAPAAQLVFPERTVCLAEDGASVAQAPARYSFAVPAVMGLALIRFSSSSAASAGVAFTEQALVTLTPDSPVTIRDARELANRVATLLDFCAGSLSPPAVLELETEDGWLELVPGDADLVSTPRKWAAFAVTDAAAETEFGAALQALFSNPDDRMAQINAALRPLGGSSDIQLRLYWALPRLEQVAKSVTVASIPGFSQKKAYVKAKLAADPEVASFAEDHVGYNAMALGRHVQGLLERLNAAGARLPETCPIDKEVERDADDIAPERLTCQIIADLRNDLFHSGLHQITLPDLYKIQLIVSALLYLQTCRDLGLSMSAIQPHAMRQIADYLPARTAT